MIDSLGCRDLCDHTACAESALSAGIDLLQKSVCVEDLFDQFRVFVRFRVFIVNTVNIGKNDQQICAP